MKPLEPLEAIAARAGLRLDALSDARDVRTRFLPALARARAFPEGFWHAEDVDSAIDVMGARLEELGIDTALVSRTALEQQLEEGADDEDADRRLSIRLVLDAVNATLDEARFHEFAEGLPAWESDEPVWLLLTEEERTLLLTRKVLSSLTP